MIKKNLVVCLDFYKKLTDYVKYCINTVVQIWEIPMEPCVEATKPAPENVGGSTPDEIARRKLLYEAAQRLAIRFGNAILENNPGIGKIQ